MLPPAPRAMSHSAASSPQPLGASSEAGFNLDAVTRHLVVGALEKTRGHKGQAAALLGVHPRTLTRMLRRFAIPED
jgi:transcriptional regulator with GAF, ATPase, and Fis domain